VNTTVIHNTYVNKTVINNNTTVNNVSYNGGTGGVNARPTAAEEAAAHEHHVAATSVQTQHEQAARSDKSMLASQNHGRPAVAATTKPGVFHGEGVVPAHSAGSNANLPGANTANNHSAMAKNDRPPSAHTNSASTSNNNRPNTAHANSTQSNPNHPVTNQSNANRPNTAHTSQSKPNTSHPPAQNHSSQPHPHEGGHPGGR